MTACRIKRSLLIMFANMALSLIPYLKVEPLMVFVGVNVWVENKVILVFANLKNLSQVSALEPRLKLESSFIGVNSNLED